MAVVAGTAENCHPYSSIHYQNHYDPKLYPFPSAESFSLEAVLLPSF
jgi:hypothetical protein